jgi:hypothetical protein
MHMQYELKSAPTACHIGQHHSSSVSGHWRARHGRSGSTSMQMARINTGAPSAACHQQARACGPQELNQNIYGQFGSTVRSVPIEDH